jgi:hypothetical protein
MVSLKDFLLEQEDINEVAAKKRDLKKLEMKCNKIVKMMKGVAQDFSKIYKPSTGDAVLYNTLKDFEEIARNVDGEYGGFFEYVYNSDYVEQ